MPGRLGNVALRPRSLVDVRSAASTKSSISDIAYRTDRTIFANFGPPPRRHSDPEALPVNLQSQILGETTWRAILNGSSKK